jgi:hypothetical protein
VIDAALRTFALVACLVIALSFGLFAAEHANDASRAQASAVVDGGGAIERQRADGHTKAREFLDDVDDVLLRPFAALVDSSNEWVARGVPALFGLLLYGVALLYLGRLLKIRSRPLVPHRERSAAPATTPGSSPPPGG